MTSNWMDVTVKVEAERIGEFYEVVGRFLMGQGMGQGQGPPSQDPPTGPATSWGDDDHDLAVAFLKKLSPPASRLLEILGSSPERRYSGEELADMIGIDNGKYGIAGTLAWPGRYCKMMGRRLPVEWDATEEGGGYYITKEVAHLFSTARGDLAA